jgi:hypothetical protein
VTPFFSVGARIYIDVPTKGSLWALFVTRGDHNSTKAILRIRK